MPHRPALHSGRRYSARSSTSVDSSRRAISAQSSTVAPATAITAVSHAFKCGSSSRIKWSIPGFCNPTELSIPLGVSVILGGGSVLAVECGALGRDPAQFGKRVQYLIFPAQIQSAGSRDGVFSVTPRYLLVNLPVTGPFLSSTLSCLFPNQFFCWEHRSIFADMRIIFPRLSRFCGAHQAGAHTAAHPFFQRNLAPHAKFTRQFHRFLSA